ncbi:MAG: DUF4080 domain-containing protein [Miniphocaeibacter sp.]|uniref:B12-binding domain-containing radical SAM protein n=1 Tax=Miniphocaeibacter sp. TaxID=3100973 RepID=UPI001852774C|nr:DUF4080 domain-containing protein [Gallicola sp.]
MKILLTSLNTKYIHSNIAIQYLKSTVKDYYEVDTKDFTINQNIDDIIYEIMKNDYDIIGFSTYIWNVEETLKICRKIKKIKEDIIIILGGPEVSYNGEELLKENTSLNYIISGEGEFVFLKLLNYIKGKENTLPNGIVERNNNNIQGNTNYQVIDDLSISEFEYTDDYIKDKKIIYYETSRGCPYNCEFCLSSSTKKVRYFDLERCKKDIKRFIDLEVPLVKFIDRTFNYDKNRALELMKFIKENDKGITTFHLEIHPTLIDGDYLDLFKNLRKDLFQFEIGVQSTNVKTCKAIKRVGEFEQIKKVCKEIISYNNIHLHLDLITGLPFEDYESLKKSFNDILSIRPDKLQLGFLKVLKGSPLWYKSKEYEIVYDDDPPFEVIYTKWISYKEIQKIKLIETLVDKYYNEKYFINTFEFLVKNFYKTDFDFFNDFSNYWKINDYYFKNHSRNNLYVIFKKFIEYKDFKFKNILKELLIHDYIITNKKIPYFLDAVIIENNLKHELLKDREILNIIGEYALDITTKKLVKNIFILKFNYDIIDVMENNNYYEKKCIVLYDNTNNAFYNITNYYKEII